MCGRSTPKVLDGCLSHYLVEQLLYRNLLVLFLVPLSVVTIYLIVRNCSGRVVNKEFQSHLRQRVEASSNAIICHYDTHEILL